MDNKKEFKSKTKTYVSEYNKKYYEENKEKHLETMRRRVECDCCKTNILKDKMNRHKLTKKHKRSEEALKMLNINQL